MKRRDKAADRPARICIVEASLQNAFFGELLDALEGELADAGVEVQRAVDHFPAPSDDLAYLFVPHEYLPLTEAEVHPTPEQLRRTLVLSTEQAGTQWFELTVSAAAHAGAVLDINELGISEWLRRGVTARRLELGHVPAWDRWGGREDAPRDIDVVFLGGHTDRRARILAGCADVLAGHKVRLHLTETAEPHKAGSPGFLQGAAKWDLLGRSKIIVNIHRDELPYLEWVRAAEAISNGCVFMTEHSNGFAPLEPQRHFVSVAHPDLPHAIESLLDDEPRLDALRRDAYALARERLPLSAAAAVVAETARDVVATAPPASAGATGITAPTPRMPPRRAPQVEQIRSQRSELDVVRGALKRLVLEQRELRALVQRQAQGSAGPAPGENGSSGGDRSWLHGPYAAATPRVSVVVTLYNYEHHIREALRSVAISDDTSHEVVVVDDASTDGSLATARTALDELPWLPAKVISRGHNGGLAAARNLGIAASRAPYVFILDADNAVYPHALDRLADTLDADPGAAFAYGIIAQYAPTGPFGLLSWHRWSARRLAHGNFVDAMAMLRRNEVVAAGGFASDPRLHGWEDFALCCEFAERGLRGVLLPEIVARYRVSPHSMISVTNIDTAEAWAALAARYPMTTAALVDEPESSGVSELPALPVSR